jgi:hypothetical protein
MYKKQIKDILNTYSRTKNSYQRFLKGKLNRDIIISIGHILIKYLDNDDYSAIDEILSYDTKWRTNYYKYIMQAIDNDMIISAYKLIQHAKTLNIDLKQYMDKQNKQTILHYRKYYWTKHGRNIINYKILCAIIIELGLLDELQLYKLLNDSLVYEIQYNNLYHVIHDEINKDINILYSNYHKKQCLNLIPVLCSKHRYESGQNDLLHLKKTIYDIIQFF